MQGRRGVSSADTTWACKNEDAVSVSSRDEPTPSLALEQAGPAPRKLHEYLANGMARVLDRREVEANLRHFERQQEDTVGRVITQMLRWGAAHISLADGTTEVLWTPGWEPAAWISAKSLSEVADIPEEDIVKFARNSHRRSGPRQGKPRVQLRTCQGIHFVRADTSD